MRILHLKAATSETESIRRALAAGGVACDLDAVVDVVQYRATLKGDVDLVVADVAHAIGGPAALEIARKSSGDTPLIVLARALDDDSVVECLKRGAADCVVADRLDRLPAVAQRAVAEVRTRAQRRESEQCLREFVEFVHGFLWIMEADGSRLLYGSPACERIWGQSVEELTARPWKRFEMILAEDRMRVEAAMDRLSRGESFDEEYRIARPDGSIRWVWDRGRPMPGAKVRLLVGLAEDITRRKELEGQLAHSQRLESLGRLAGGVAHDLNNQLCVILGSAELACEANLDDAVHVDLEMILQGASKAATLTGQLLAFSRRQVLKPRVTDLNDAVQEAQSMLVRVLPEDVELTLKADADPATVRVDATQLEQAIVNLAINARDAMPSGGTLTIQTSSVVLDAAPAPGERLLEPGPYVVITVRDTGCGMNSETIAQIFEPFFTTKEIGKGTGLGLAVAHGFVRQSGGDILVESEPGVGTTFELYLPLVESEPDVAPAPAPRTLARGSETILLVEDDALVLETLRRLLVRRGYRVIAVVSAEEALEVVNDEDARVDLLITDVVMPSLSGQQLARRVRKRWPEVRVLFISGHADEAIASHGEMVSDSLFVEKPLSDLCDRVREALQLHDSSAAGRPTAGRHE